MLSGLLDSLLRNAAATYTRGRWAWHVAAGALTAVLVISGADWYFFTHTRSEILTPVIYAAGIGGFFVPVLVPVALYIRSWRLHSERIRLSSFAAAQSVVIAWCISSFYKALTGRIEPEFLTQLMDDRSRTFNFGFLEYGIFWGWPSSHTAVAVALAVALTVCYKGSPRVKALSAAYASFVGFGAAVGFHWLSDVLAGAIVGAAAGLAVGSHFAAKIRAAEAAENESRLAGGFRA